MSEQSGNGLDALRKRHRRAQEARGDLTDPDALPPPFNFLIERTREAKLSRSEDIITKEQAEELKKSIENLREVVIKQGEVYTNAPFYQEQLEEGLVSEPDAKNRRFIAYEGEHVIIADIIPPKESIERRLWFSGEGEGIAYAVSFDFNNNFSLFLEFIDQEQTEKTESVYTITVPIDNMTKDEHDFVQGECERIFTSITPDPKSND